MNEYYAALHQFVLRCFFGDYDSAIGLFVGMSRGHSVKNIEQLIDRRLVVVPKGIQ